jgi:hypothetical protein
MNNFAESGDVLFAASHSNFCTSLFRLVAKSDCVRALVFGFGFVSGSQAANNQ